MDPYIGRNCIGHNYIGHDYVGHTMTHTTNITIKEINIYNETQFKFAEWMKRLEATDSLKVNPLTKEDEVTLKYFKKKDHLLELIPANKDFSTIEIDLREQEAFVEGKSVGLIRTH